MSLAAEGATPAPGAINRPMIVVSVMLSMVMTVLDTTIANVALPHMAGSMSASTEQIAWVLTSYIVATAITTPLSGWLSSRFGRKRVLVVSVIGFVAASALCGAAQNLTSIVLFRAMQGAFAAPLQPLAQAIMLDIFTVAERGGAMALWGVGVMVAPIVGPVLGGVLTDTMSWRWVFYINLPIGALSLLGILTFVPEAKSARAPFGLAGFLMLGLAIAAAQLMLDRGQGQGWFGSSEIVLEATVALVAFWFFLVHSFTSRRPFLPLAIFKDRNFTLCCVFIVVLAALMMSVAALVPSMLQTLFGYSVVQAGMAMAPRGVGSLISMLVVGRLIGRIEPRLLMTIGLLVFAFSFWEMSGFTLDTSQTTVAVNGFVQGLGVGFIFLPITTMAFATLAPALRNDGTSVYSLWRNLGGSAGISIMLAMITNFTVSTRAGLIAPFSSDNANVRAVLPAPYSLTDPAGMAVLSGAIDQQAAMVAYTSVFHVMFFASLAVMPLLLILRQQKVDAHGVRETIVRD
ncbi:MAG: DHA2 family efflux MFS transporter permease subunit [Hyphomonadaceae bacterium]